MGYKMVLVMQCAKYYILICLSIIDLNAGLLGQMVEPKCWFTFVLFLNPTVGLFYFFKLSGCVFPYLTQRWVETNIF